LQKHKTIVDFFDFIEVEPRSIQRIKVGHRNPSFAALIAFAKALNV